MIDFPNIDPVAFEIGPLVVRWYSLAYLAGFLLGWRYALLLATQDTSRAKPTKTDIDDFLGWAILGTILGGRIGYVLFYNPAHFLQNPSEIIMIWQGGMSFHGGLLGVVCAVLLFSHLRKIPFWRMSDIMCCVAPIGLFFGRIANFINGELYGRVTESPFGMVFPRGGELPRHPSQIYEAVLEGLVLLIVLFVLSRKEKIRHCHGFLTGVFFVGYGLSRFMVEFVREPDGHIGYYLNMLTMGQLLCVPMIILGVIFMIRAVQNNERA